MASETNYKVYLNLENPLHIDADSSNWDEIQIHDKDKILKNVEYSSVQINDHNDGTYDVEYKDDMDSAKYKHEEFGSLEELESKFGKDILTYYTDDYGYYNMVHIDKDGFFFPSTTRGISDYASRRGYDGVIIDNLYDSGMDDYNAPSSQVAIAFESNQIKSVNNENPTEDADIRYSDKQEFSKEAEEFFGTTDNYNLAGYITLDGKLLDFSAGQGQRVMDHRDVADFYEEKGIELSNNTSGSGLLDEGMLRFMADGNIRFSAVHGIEIVKEPTSEQYSTIRDAVRNAFYNEMSIDYSTEDGRYLGTTYYDEPNPTRVVNDIKSFFETGKVPEDVSIRFSEKQKDPSYKILGENERLKKQIASLKQDVSDLTELVKLASKVTNGRVWTPTELTSAAESIAKSVQSTYDIKALREDLAKAYENITKWLSESTGDSEADMNYVMAQCTEVARDVLEASTYKPISDAKILSAIKKSNVDLGENASELVAEASEMIKRVDYEENLQKLATKIYQKYWTVHKIKTPTDIAKAKASDAKSEYNKRVKQIDAKHQAEMDKMRKALSDQRLADRIHYERMLNELRNNRDEKITQLKEFTKKRETERKDFAERKATIRKITDTSMTLNKWLRENNVKHPIPEPLKKPIAALLNAIDFSSKQLLGLNGDLNAGVPTKKDESFVKALEMVHSMALNNDAEIRESEFSELDLPENFAEAIDKVYKNVIEIERNVREDNGYILQLMSTEDLKELYVMVKALKTSVMQMNKFISTANAHSMDEIGGEFFKYADAHKQKKHDNVITDFFENGETTPYYFFKRLGKAGDFIFDLLANANDKETNLVGRIKEVADETYTAEEIKTWQKEIHEFTVLEDDGEGGQQQTQIRMTVPQMMSLYCLNRRQQAEGHLLGGGIRVEAFKDGLKTVNQVNSFTATQETINNIIAELSTRQKEVARDLQKFMSTECADWGNEVTMKRFGIKGFTEENYFPITSDSNVLKNGGKERQKSLYALLNMSFTKALTKGANNQIVLQNIFDVFANHTSEMAKYSAWALPVLDTIRWWNYKERTDKGDAFTDRTVRSQMEYLLGTPANKYLRTLLDDLNGTRADERLGKIAKMTTRAYKSAAVGFNIQTALLQPISYWRATYKMPTKYLLMGLTKLPSIQKCQNNVALARWKSMGFFETDVSRGVASMIKHDETVVDKVIDASMKMAEWGDTITWGFLYNACEAEIRNTTNLVPNSNEFNDAVALRMRDIIYSTQVVDSTLTRSTFMRDPGLFAKTTTAFLSEPTLAVNVALDAYSRFAEDSRQYGFNEAFKRNGKTFAKAFEAVLITSIVESLLRAAIGKVREPEDDEAYIDSVLSHFREELNPLGKLPIFKDLVSVFQGYSVSRMDEAAFQSVYYAYKAFFKMLDEGADYKSIYRIAQAFSQLSGMPISAIMREGETMVNLWNMIVGNQYPSTKLD